MPNISFVKFPLCQTCLGPVHKLRILRAGGLYWYTSLPSLWTALYGQTYQTRRNYISPSFAQPSDTQSSFPDEIVAQFKNTVLILPNGLTVVTGTTFDVNCFESEHSVQDEEMKKLLESELVLADAKKTALANLTKAAAAPKATAAAASATPAPAAADGTAATAAAKDKKKKKKKKAAAGGAATEEAGKENAA